MCIAEIRLGRCGNCGNRKRGMSSDGRRGGAACGEDPPTVRGDSAQRLLDLVVSGLGLILLLPVLVLGGVAIVLDSRGGIFYRCRRVGRGGDEFGMLKFRKMRKDASGAPLTAVEDDRFTRVGRLLARTKLDEIPQLLNVLAGSMSLVGPRPEDPAFVAPRAVDYERILRVRPGITGLSQLAFAREMEILDPADRVADYVARVMPQKMALDELYADRRSIAVDLRILFWTFVAVVLRREVAVNRQTGHLNLRRRPRTSEALQMEGVRS
jgi:lipopolysaccharide/colanic/teichoic acid biosynthesis glycosyltransferase